MKSKKELAAWEEFYKLVGGKFICTECGQIMNWAEKDLANTTRGKDFLIAFLISFVLTPIAGAIWLFSFAKPRGCSKCHNKRIVDLSSEEGIDIFKEKYPEYIDYLPQTRVKRVKKNEKH